MKKKESKYPARWHLFGNCGGWDEFHVWCNTKKMALREATPYIKFYGYGYIFLEDTKTNRTWKLAKLDNLDYIEQLAKKRKLI